MKVYKVKVVYPDLTWLECSFNYLEDREDFIMWDIALSETENRYLRYEEEVDLTN